MSGNRISLIAVFIIIFITTQVISVNSQEDLYENLFVRLYFSPPAVEAGKATHPAGYIQLVDSNGSPVLAPEDLTITLTSKDPAIASVQSEVVIPVNNDYVRFDVSVGELEGETEISAIFQEQSFNRVFRVGGIKVDVPLNVDLEINPVATSMHVDSNMIISVFLNNSGTILQAPKDINIRFEYERSLLKIQNDQITIKQGDYYAITNVRTLDKTGTAFIKAITDEPPLESIERLVITSSLPKRLRVDVLPSNVVEMVDREIDIFVSLVDENNNPVKAVQDMPLEFFSNVGELDDELETSFKIVKPVIRKGQWGFYHKQDRILFDEGTPRTFVGVSSPGFGQTLGYFTILKELKENHFLAENKTFRIYHPERMPPNSVGIIVYQFSALKGDDDDQAVIDELIDEGLIAGHPFANSEDWEEGSMYPLKSDYDDFSRDDLKVKPISSNENIIKIINGGELSPKRTYGTAIIQSGKDGTATISIGVKGLASGTNSTDVFDAKSPHETLVYSPAGKSRIVFNNEGLADLYLTLLDSASRPTITQEQLSFSVKPTNELIEFLPRSSSVAMKIKSSSFARDLETGRSLISVLPTGTDINTDLETRTLFEIAPASSTTNIFIPFTKIVGIEEKTHQFGIIQLSDFFGNPVKVTSDLRVELLINNTEIAKIPTIVTIPTGKSFVEFPVTTFGETGAIEISANAKGFYSSKATLELIPFVKELVIFPVYPTEPVMPGSSIEVQIFVDDENAVSVEGALLEVFASSNSTVFPPSVTTNANGEATVLFTAGVAPATLEIFATKAGYTPDQTTLEFEIVSIEQAGTQTIFGIPPLYLYLAIGGAAGGGGFMAFRLLRKPKVMTEEEAEEEEI